MASGNNGCGLGHGLVISAATTTEQIRSFDEVDRYIERQNDSSIVLYNDRLPKQASGQPGTGIPRRTGVLSAEHRIVVCRCSVTAWLPFGNWNAGSQGRLYGDWTSGHHSLVPLYRSFVVCPNPFT